jgi:nucleotide-binding universal stress UspA family protein
MTQKPILLVPTDFSETSQSALDLAKELAAALGAEIVLLHVFEPPIVYPEISPAFVDSFYRELVPAGKRQLAELAARSGVTRTLVREGRAGQEIVEAAKAVFPKLIVLGTHGRRAIQRLLLGSVAEYVVRHAGAPVVTVRSAPAK